MQAVVDDLLIQYERTGQGKPVLLLHGWGDNLKTFKDLDLKEYELIAADLPGMGSSEAPHEPWGLDDYAVMLKKLLEKLRITDLYAIIGHSNGGAIAIHGLASGSLNAKKLVLLSSAGVRDKDTTKKQTLKVVARSGKLASKILPGATQQKLRKKFYGAIGSDLTLMPHMEETFKRIVSTDVQVDAEKIAIPTLLIYGELDTSTPPEYGKLLHKRIKDSRLELVPDTGHFVHQENTALVNSQVRDFLGQ